MLKDHPELLAGQGGGEGGQSIASREDICYCASPENMLAWVPACSTRGDLCGVKAALNRGSDLL